MYTRVPPRPLPVSSTQCNAARAVHKQSTLAQAAAGLVAKVVAHVTAVVVAVEAAEEAAGLATTAESAVASLLKVPQAEAVALVAASDSCFSCLSCFHPTQKAQQEQDEQGCLVLGHTPLHLEQRLDILCIELASLHSLNHPVQLQLPQDAPLEPHAESPFPEGADVDVDVDQNKQEQKPGVQATCAAGPTPERESGQKCKSARAAARALARRFKDEPGHRNKEKGNTKEGELGHEHENERMNEDENKDVHCSLPAQCDYQCQYQCQAHDEEQLPLLLSARGGKSTRARARALARQKAHDTRSLQAHG
jgi:hypothetical protein